MEYSKIFLDMNSFLDLKNKKIIKNKKKNIKLKNNDFKILDNFRDRCFYMVKK